MRQTSRGVLLGLTVAAATVVLLVPLPRSLRTGWPNRLLDLGHVPLFALITAVSVWGLGWNRWSAFGFAVLLAAAGELGQAFAGRSADFFDLLRGALGSMVAVVWLNRPRAVGVPRHLLGRLGLTFALLGWPVSAPLPAVADAYFAHQSFPTICDFQTRWETTRWRIEEAAIRRVPDPKDAARWLGRIDFSPAESSGAVLFPVVRDWSQYDRCCLEFSFEGDPIDFLISIRDGRKVTGPLQRFDLEQRFEPGEHRLCLDLKSLASGGQFAPLNISHIESFHLFAKNLPETRTVLVRSIRLERGTVEK